MCGHSDVQCRGEDTAKEARQDSHRDAVGAGEGCDTLLEVEHDAVLPPGWCSKEGYMRHAKGVDRLVVVEPQDAKRDSVVISLRGASQLLVRGEYLHKHG